MRVRNVHNNPAGNGKKFPRSWQRLSGVLPRVAGQDPGIGKSFFTQLAAIVFFPSESPHVCGQVAGL